MREGNIIKRTLAAMLACVIVFTGGIGITARRALAYNAGVEAFVNSLYSDCLGRTADPAGFNDWCTRLTNGSITGKQAAYGFFYSSEFINTEMTCSQAIDIFYRVFLNRTADPAGKAYWLGQISQIDFMGDLGTLFTGFADSTEFADKCASYGIIAGPHINVATGTASGFTVDTTATDARGITGSSGYPGDISGIQWYYDNGFREYNIYLGLGRYQRCLYREFDCTAEYNAINNYRAGMGLAPYNVYTDGPFHDYVLIRAIEVAYNFDHSSPCYWAYPKYMNVVIPEESHHAPDMPVLGVTVTENILSGSTDIYLPFDYYVNSPMHEKEYRYRMFWNGSEYVDLGDNHQNHNMAAASVEVYFVLDDGTITSRSPMATDTTIVHHFDDMPFNSFYDERTTGRSEVEIFWI